jgi:hypothetical protein
MFPKALRREIVALLFAKALLLTAIYQLFFAPYASPQPDRSATLAHLLQAGGR